MSTQKFWKVWGWWPTSSNSNLRSSRGDGGEEGTSNSTGDFDRIPDEILVLIMKKLGPKETTKLCSVCKSWRDFVSSENKLWIHFFQSDVKEPNWESVFFAETHLRSGYPLQPVYDQTPPLSLMNVYALRAKVPGTIIVDGGSGYCKLGWSKYHGPSGRFATFLEFGNVEAPMYSRLRHFYSTIYNRMANSSAGYPTCCDLKPLVLSNTRNTVFKRMQVRPTGQPIVVSIPICHNDDNESAKASRRQLKEAIYSALFDMNVPAVCAISQATLALYAARRTSGIVVNVGFYQTSVVPILHGKIMRKVGVEVVGMGALKLTGFLREQMQLKNISFESLYTVRELKENLCYVAYDYDAELAKNTQASYEVSREGVFTLSEERFQTGELLFQPRIAGIRAMGLHQAVALCMDHCHSAELMGDDDSWFKTVVLCGGTACLPGLPERLEKELHSAIPSYISSGIKVLPPPHGVDTTWHGARLISNLSSFPDSWCITKKQFKHKSRKNRGGLW